MSLMPGTRIGPYEVGSPIGAGGMGEVYRARDAKLGREVAIKVLPEELSRHPERVQRFEREARLLAQLNHPNIATIHGLEEDAGRQCLVMELVEGETLAEHLARGPLPFDEALPLFIAIAEGLEAAHEKGIIHRDLVVDVNPESDRFLSRPRMLLETSGLTQFDVSPDGRHFALTKSGEASAAPTQLHLVLNWGEELKRLVP